VSSNLSRNSVQWLECDLLAPSSSTTCLKNLTSPTPTCIGSESVPTKVPSKHYMDSALRVYSLSKSSHCLVAS